MPKAEKGPAPAPTKQKPRPANKAVATERRRAKKATYHHGDLRAALLAAARECLEEKGAQGLSFREVARKAGVSHAAPYHHFSDKQALLAALAIEAFDGLTAEMERFVAQLPDDATEFQRLVALGRGYVHFALQQSAAFKLMWQHDEVDIGASEPLGASAQRAYLALSERVDAVHSAVGHGPQPASLDNILMWSIVHGVASLFLTRALGIPAEEFETVVHAMLERSIGSFLVDTDPRLPKDAHTPIDKLKPDDFRNECC